jgi:TolA-binding protein
MIGTRQSSGRARPGAWAAWVLGFGLAVLAAEPAMGQDGGNFSERLAAARAAFDGGDWAGAAAGFEALDKDFGANPEAAKALAAHRSLRALALVRSGAWEPALAAIAAAQAVPETPAAARELLAYFHGVCLFQLRRWEESRAAFLAYFNVPAHDRQRRLEALLAAGSTLLEEEKHAEAAEFFAQSAERIRQAEPARAARFGLLRLRALMASGDLDGALAAVRDGYANIASQPQVIAFQSLTLQLGQRFLDESRWHDAIVCFQRVWARERLLRHQRDRVEAWQRERLLASGSPGGAAEVLRLDGLLEAARGEIAGLEKNADFDAAARFRLASAFLRLGRHREAAMVLEAMVAALPPAPLVEQAALPLAQCWFEARRWEKVEETAALYEQRFAALEFAKLHPDILMLMALAQENDARYPEAAATCAALVARYPKAPLAATAAFKHGYLLLMADDYAGGLKALRAFPGTHAGSPLVEDAHYWEGEALALAGEHGAAREHLEKHLSMVKAGAFRGDYVDAAAFRRAYCRFAMADYEGAAGELAGFLREHPASDSIPEANLLLGDALGGLGRLEEAQAAYDRIPPAAGRFFDEAIFKKGKILRLASGPAAVREHFAAYLEAHPESGRAAEAVHWIGWSWDQEGQPARAREAWWQAVEDLGGDPDQLAVEDLLESLEKMHRSDEESGRQFNTRLQKISDARPADGPDILACRAHWARGRFARRAEPAQFRAEMMRARERLDPRAHSPRLAVDIAAALEESGLDAQAADLLVEVRRWHPRTLEKARIFSTLGRIALRRGQPEEAEAAFARFEEEAIAPPPALRAEVALARARLDAAAGRKASALERFKEIQGDRALPARTRAEAHAAAGDMLAGDDPAAAAVHFERVYVAYAGFADLAAAAYVARAESLVRLGRADLAREVLADLLGRDEFAGQSGPRARAESLLATLP